jgi:hypothetical protein
MRYNGKTYQAKYTNFLKIHYKNLQCLVPEFIAQESHVDFSLLGHPKQEKK